jgi:hypothetical protein
MQLWPYACGEVPSEQLTGDNRAHAEARISKRDTYAAGGVAPPPSPAGAERIGSEAAGSKAARMSTCAWQQSFARPPSHAQPSRATTLDDFLAAEQNLSRAVCSTSLMLLLHRRRRVPNIPSNRSFSAQESCQDATVPANPLRQGIRSPASSYATSSPARMHVRSAEPFRLRTVAP